MIQPTIVGARGGRGAARSQRFTLLPAHLVPLQCRSCLNGYNMVTQASGSYADIHTWENLYLAYRKAARGKRGRAAAAGFEDPLPALAVCQASQR
jgi:hypothetical protein